MSKTIWKFPLHGPGQFTASMPDGAEIIDAQMQGGVPCLWAIVDVGAIQRTREFRIFVTGQRLDESLSRKDHISTVQDGSFVWHIFEVKR